jgi:hypothetical protein
MKATGMDTIAYLMDPETSDMVSVVLKHTRFTVDSATALASREQARKYADNDRDNHDTAATECLLDSVSPDLKKRARNRIEDTDTFPKVWIEFSALVLSTSIDGYEEKLKKRIQGRHRSVAIYRPGHGQSGGRLHHRRQDADDGWAL